MEQKQDEDSGGSSILKKAKEKVVLSNELAQISPVAVENLKILNKGRKK